MSSQSYYSDGDSESTQVGSVDETFVSIRHKSSNFAYRISLDVPEVKLEEFPEETFKFDIVLNRACLYCYSQFDERETSESSSSSSSMSDSRSSEEETSKEACLCTGRCYRCKLLFTNISEDILNDYSYKVSARFVCQGNKDIFLFSHTFRKTHLLETLDDVCLKNRTNVQYSKVKEICFEIHRQKTNQVMNTNLDRSFVSRQLLHTDPSTGNAVLKVSEKLFHVNKKILSSKSQVFEKIFSSKPRGKKPKPVEVDGFDADVIEIMLLFIYTNRDEYIYKNPVEVYRAAHKYEVEDLMDKCLEWMKFNIDKNNFVPISKLAFSYELGDLQRMITKFEDSHIISLVNTQEYQDLLIHNLKVETVVQTLKICDRFSSSLGEVEKEVFNFVKENAPDIVDRKDFSMLFKDNHNLIQKLFTFLFSQDGTKKRKLSDSLDTPLKKERTE